MKDEFKLKDEYTCHDFSEIAEVIGDMRRWILFSFEKAGCSPMANQQFLMSLTDLEQAYNHMKMAEYFQMKGE